MKRVAKFNELMFVSQSTLSLKDKTHVASMDFSVFQYRSVKLVFSG